MPNHYDKCSHATLVDIVTRHDEKVHNLEGQIEALLLICLRQRGHLSHALEDVRALISHCYDDPDAPVVSGIIPELERALAIALPKIKL